ncbi:DNA polymerase III subunit beta [Proteus phage 3H10_20]|uniref:DNA polymerase III subunit beta n=1 Tax=Proteus phage 3H10_20 TaxID=2772448 RepID=A0A7L7SH53_9CAUD|nr:ATPase [Proteus phage 3H10_20]QOC54884.1 DNA polymerase III subunit beta [Proteus phage 3H10_20]
MLQKQSRIITMASHVDERFPVLKGGHYTFEPASMTSPAMFIEVNAPAIPEKIYGDPSSKVSDILKTISDRSPANNTGVLAVGEKGSGKTMMLNMLICALAETGFPIIHVNNPFNSSILTSIIEMAGRPVVFFIDEFEKKYKETEQQNNLLTIMDGGIYTGNVFLLSANVKKVSEYMIDRPNRIHYTLKYTNLSWDVIQDYLDDKLENKDHVENFRIMSENSNMNFDILQNLTAEINRFPDRPFVESVRMMGLSIQLDGVEKRYSITECLLGGTDVSGFVRERSYIPSLLSNKKQSVYVNFNGDKIFSRIKGFIADKLEIDFNSESFDAYDVDQAVHSYLQSIEGIHDSSVDYNKYKDSSGSDKETFSMSFYVKAENPRSVSVKKDYVEIKMELFGLPLFVRIDQVKQIDLIDVIFS